jgi:dTDP-4-dehydrorhamnose 3,5-epimerase
VKVTRTALEGVLIVEPKVFEDERGFFLESYNERVFAEATGVTPRFVQDNHSKSVRGVLRGLHYQVVRPQGKLVRAAAGSLLDVAVDLRRSSPTFGRHVAAELNAENRRQLWIPAGFAHGFVVLSETAELLYKTTEYWYPEHDRTLAWNDPDLGIDWRVATPTLSSKDQQGRRLAEAELFD